MARIACSVILTSLICLLCFEAAFAQGSPENQIGGKKSQFSDLENCYGYHANPHTGRYILIREAGELYFLSKKLEKNGSTVFLSKIDISNFKVSNVVKLDADIGLVLTEMGIDFDGVNAFNFTGASYGCGHGYSAGIGLMWKGSVRIIDSFAKKLYKVVPSDTLSSLVVDLEKNVITEFDAASFQMRTYSNLPDDLGLPLFVGFKSKRIFFINTQNSKKMLVRYNSSINRRDSVMKLADDMRVVQDQSHFAISQQKEDKIVVRIFSGWSDSKLDKVSFPLPKELMKEKVRVDMKFSSGLAVLSAAMIGAQKSIAGAWLVDGVKEKVLASIMPDPGYYVSQVINDSKNEQFILLTNHIDNDQTGAIFVYKVKRNKVIRIPWSN